MCQSYLNNEWYYRYLLENDPSLTMYENILNYRNKYRNILTDSEYQYLVNHIYKISYFYTNHKLHKSMNSTKININ